MRSRLLSVEQQDHRDAGVTKGEHRRALLLQALDRMLEVTPLGDVSVAALTREAGVTRSGFYFYFDSVPDAVGALLEDLLEEIMVFGAPFFAGGDLRATLDSSIRALHGVFHDHRGLFLAVLDARRTNESVREVWDTWLLQFVGPTAARLRADGATVAVDDAAGERAAMILIWATEATLERDLREHEDVQHGDEMIAALVDLWVTVVGSTA